MKYEQLKTALLENRNFRPENYVAQKLKAINDFFRSEKLDSCVIGVSGGVDSALVMKLMHEASKISDSPIKEIVGLVMPINCLGTTGQELATEKAERFCKESGYYYNLVNLSEAMKPYQRGMDNYMPSNWSIGQLASIVRTPALYFQAALLQQHGYRSVVVGTTNRDEGSYIGFFGKASDAMVDLQPIADLHKTEVYELAEYFNIPQYITGDKPRGDVWDGKCDEEMIGAPYHFLQIFLLAKYRGIDLIHLEDFEDYKEWYSNIERIHKSNSHKYKVANSARFINVLDSDIPGGWQNDRITHEILGM